MTSWDMWVHKGPQRFEHFGERWWVELHGLDAPVVPVRVTLDPLGDYWGWQETGKEAHAPEMIQSERMLLDMCFTYGMKAEIDAGKGAARRLRVEELWLGTITATHGCAHQTAHSNHRSDLRGADLTGADLTGTILIHGPAYEVTP